MVASRLIVCSLEVHGRRYTIMVAFITQLEAS